jgi:amino acid adenylation domain-containing protein
MAITTQPQTLIDLLEFRAERDPSLPVFSFLPEGEEAQGALTAADLELRARGVGAWLAELGLARQRVVLLFPQGIEFIEAYFGCAYAGAVAVPAPMPHASRLARTLPRLRGMVADAQPAAVLTNREGLAMAAQIMEHLPAGERTLRWLALEDCPPDLHTSWIRPSLSPEAPAHLQYTSGSTASPKGTIITQGNIVDNSRAIQAGWRYSRESRSVVWVPHFHDDGLIQGLIQPIFTGYPCILFPAAAFVSRPLRWLRALSHHRGTHGGGPNFAYELCIRKVSDDERGALDLSNWRFAYNAAEPVRAETLRRFHERFAPAGFRWQSFAPCFGLAEATLLVSTGLHEEGPRVIHVDSAALEKSGVIKVVPEGTPNARTLVGCGPPGLDTEVVIVDQATGERCAPDRIGEILVKSPSIAKGYLNFPEESERTFRGRLDDDGGPYLRTGDQGFLLASELFITGRIKDMIIIRGENRYPQDIEWSVERCHPAIAPGSIAAFSYEAEKEERLVIVAEVKGAKPAQGELEPIFDAIREAIFQDHDLTPWAIALLPGGALPKTSSGKIQRGACKVCFREGTLRELGRSTAILPRAAEPAPELPRDAAVKGKSAAEIQAFLSRYLTSEFGVPRDSIALDAPFSRYGLDSASSVRLAADLGDWLGERLPNVAAWNYPNILALSRHLAGEEPPRALRGARESSAEPIPRPPLEPIAIIGASCRFPGGVVDIEGLRRLLERGVDAIEEVPGERWDIERYYHRDPDAPGKMVTRWGGFLRDVDRFEPGFFEISPREASEMDPQQRILLEVSWEALEQAGQTLSRLRGTDTGVYVGISSNEYQAMGMAREGALSPHLFLGTAHSTGVGRLSYWLGLNGPNLPVNTACSSSLVAVHLACQALRAGECSMALAGGVNLILSPEATLCLSQMRALSPTGRCHAFSADADGYVRSEGCGVVVLKRLSDALRDGDPILALLRGSALNQDGRSNGLTAPSGPAQEDVIRRALAQAGIAPSAVGLIEAHGTGTPLGDPIEAGALAAVLGEGRRPDQKVMIGSIKTNIGHAESAAGVAGLLKAVVAVSGDMIPRSLHLTALSPHIPWSSLPLTVAAEATPWAPGAPKIAGVSSFGMSGTNAHILVEEAPRRASDAVAREASSYLLPLSAKSPEALSALARAYGSFLEGTKDWLHDVAYTASARRTHHEHRLAVGGRSREEIAAALSAFGRGERPFGLLTGKAPSAAPQVVFVFSGQGSQWAGMGRALLEEEPLFRSAMEACDQALRPHAGFSVIEEIARPEPSSRLGETDVAQPTLFAVEVSLAALLRSWGAVPDLLIGHSVGEIAAAHVAGILDLESAARLVSLRGRVMQKATGHGKMVSVTLPEEEAQRALIGIEDRVSLAAVNDPGQAVLAGDAAALDALVDRLTARGVDCRPLRVNYAFHSPQMDPLRDEFVKALGAVSPTRGTTPMISAVTGEKIAGGDLSAAYWGDNIRETVRFARAIQAARSSGPTLFVEVGPHPVLAVNMRQTLAATRQEGQVIPTLRRQRGDRLCLLESLGALYVHGALPDLERLFPEPGRVVGLPSYPFQRERCWIDTTTKRRPSATLASGHPLMGASISSSLHEGTHLWQRALSIAEAPYLAEHRVQGALVFPGVGYVEMALVACAEALGVPDAALVDVAIARVLIVPEEGERLLQVTVTEDAPGEVSFQIATREEGERRWQRHAAGKARAAGESDGQPPDTTRVWREPEDAAARAAVHHEQMRSWQFELGPAFQGMIALWEEDGETRGRVRLPVGLADAGYRIHPAMLDACIQVAAGLFRRGTEDESYLPVGFARVHIASQPGREIWVSARRRPEAETDPREGVCDITLSGADGVVVGMIQGLRVRRLPAVALRRDALDQSAYEIAWRKVTPLLDAPLPEGAWLVFNVGGERGALGATIAGRIRAQGQRCVRVAAGVSYERIEPDLYQINPSRPEDYRRLLEEAIGEEGRCAGVVHLWSLDSAPLEESQFEDLTRSSVSATYLAQALVHRSRPAPPRLWLVTRGAQALGGGEAAVSVTQAPLWGLGRTLALEHPELRCTRVDLDPVVGETSAALLLRELAAEGEDQIALRGDDRLVARLVRGTFPGAEPASLRADAAYLITGGLGGLGLVLARWMVERGARHLFLAGRRAPGDAARGVIQAMQACGAEITCVQTEVSSRADMERLFAAIRARGAALRGVVHAAGVLSDHALIQQSEASFREVFGPKALGALHLHALTRGDDLDFFVMYSSAASLLGSTGQGNYAAANALLDALAWERARAGRPAMSVQWGAFADVGLAAQAGRAEHLSRIGIGSLSPDEGLQALAGLLAQPRPAVGIVRFDLKAWGDAHPGAAVSPFLSELPRDSAPARGAAAAMGLRQALFARAPADRLPLLIEHVLREVASVLRMDSKRIDPAASFVTLGIDSLMSVELRGRLSAIVGIELPAMILFTYSDATSFAAHLLTRLEKSQADGGAGETSASAAAGAEAPIPRLTLPDSGIVPVSPGQARIWFFERLSPVRALYNLHVGLRLHGRLDRAALRRSFEALAARHASLRTTFAELDGQPVARVAPRTDLELHEVDLRPLPEACREQELAERASAFPTMPFDLGRGPLWRVMLLALEDERHVLFWTHHHSISDGWSGVLLFGELARLYRGFTEGKPADLPALPLEYTDYAAFQNAAQREERHQLGVAWWRERLAGMPRLELPYDRSVAAPTYAGAAVSFSLTAGISARLEEFAAREGCTLFAALISAWVALLHTYTGQDDFPVGIVSAGRNRKELTPIVGFFVNTLVLRCDVSGAPSFSELMKRLREVIAFALAHEDVSFDEVVRATSAPRGRDLNPLYQASFVMENVPFLDLDLPEARWSLILDRIDGSVEGTAKNELCLSMVKLPDGLHGSLEFATDLFDRSSIERMAARLQSLLSAIADDPQESLAALSLITEAERRKLLAWGAAEPSGAPDRCVHALFEEQVQRTPDAIAVECEGERLTYAALDAEANRLAHHLRDLGVGPEVRVALCVGRSPALLVGLWAILKAGGAYVPLDVSYPTERLAYMLSDAGAKVLLTEAHLEQKLPRQDGVVVRLDADAAAWSARPSTPPECGVGPSNMLYVIYTSGSTGQPKGVVIEHRSVVSLLSGITRKGRYAPPSRVLHRASLAFDVSVLEVIGPLLAGACVVMAPGDVARTPPALAALLRHRGVTYADFPPALLGYMLDEPDFVEAESLRLITVGGEAPDAALIEAFARKSRAELWNNYGPTEATIEATSWPVVRYRETGGIRVGRPLPGYRVYVVDKRGELCPEGIPGELCIGGAGVARGYLDRPELTQERFVPDPFSGEPLGRMYRTGDRARWAEGGELLFLGRIDRQIKLRGFRIELDEVEAAILCHPSVRSCVVMVREDNPGNHQLVAYVVPSDADATPSRLRDHLRSRLPDPMIPSMIMLLSAMPLTPNGKVDRAALPAPELTREGVSAGYTAPRTEIEQEIVAMWEELLGLHPVGIHDDFFAIGGHSLMAIRLGAALEKRYHRGLPLAEVFAKRTVAEMAQALFPAGGGERITADHSAAGSPVVALRRGGSRPPLFCIQPTGATVFCYADLTREFGPDQPVYGLQEGILEPGSKHLETIEALAAHFVRFVRQIQPNGPYHLTGWSFGGTVAFEMARQLRREGIPVERLILLDSPIPMSMAFNTEDPLAHLLVAARYVHGQGAELDMEALRSLPLAAAEDMVGQAIERAGWFPEGGGKRFVVGLSANIEAHWMAQRRYKPEPYDGELIMVRAPERLPYRGGLAEPSWDWSPLCAGSYRVYSIPGPHSKMVYPPYVGALARLMRRLLDGEVPAPE